MTRDTLSEQLRRLWASYAKPDPKDREMVEGLRKRP
jgi:hypothetical protein